MAFIAVLDQDRANLRFKELNSSSIVRTRELSTSKAKQQDRCTVLIVLGLFLGGLFGFTAMTVWPDDDVLR